MYLEKIEGSGNFHYHKTDIHHYEDENTGKHIGLIICIGSNRLECQTIIIQGETSRLLERKLHELGVDVNKIIEEYNRSIPESYFKNLNKYNFPTAQNNQTNG